MDRTQKLQYQKSAEQYLESKNVYEIFEDLMQKLIINQPPNPVDFLIDKLAKPQRITTQT